MDCFRSIFRCIPTPEPRLPTPPPPPVIAGSELQRRYAIKFNKNSRRRHRMVGHHVECINLTPKVAKIGGEVTYRVKFAADIKEYRVVWYVGRYLVTKDSEHFKVTNRKGYSEIRILHLTRAMMGEICCELFAIKDHTESLVKQAISFLLLNEQSDEDWCVPNSSPDKDGQGKVIKSAK